MPNKTSLELEIQVCGHCIELCCLKQEFILERIPVTFNCIMKQFLNFPLFKKIQGKTNPSGYQAYNVGLG